MFVQEMTRQECIAVVSAGRLGRLACARDNRPYVVPIYYAFAENHLLQLFNAWSEGRLDADQSKRLRPG